MKSILTFLLIWTLTLPIYLIFDILWLGDILTKFERATNFYLNWTSGFIIPLSTLLVGLIYISKRKNEKLNPTKLFITLVIIIIGFVILFSALSILGGS